MPSESSVRESTAYPKIGGVPMLAALARRRQITAITTLAFMLFLFFGHKNGTKRLIVCWSVDWLITYYMGIIMIISIKLILF
jgi:hypothetical protein